MKKITTITLLGLFVLKTAAFGQTVTEISAINKLKISQVTFKGYGDSLLLDMTISLADVKPGSMERITVTPLIMDSLGNSIALHSFFIDGKIRTRASYRDALLDKQKTKPDYKKEYHYTEQLLLLPWMERAGLVVKGSVDCCGNNESSYFRTIADRIDYNLPAQRYAMRPQVNFITPDAEPIKNRVESGSAKLEFLSGKSAIALSYKNNQQELNSIGNVINKVLNDSTAKISSILLRAYSSPEGSYAANAKLSSARSVELRKYLETAYNLQGIHLITESVAEDWDGLEKLIKESDIPQKQQFLDIITKNADPDTREKLFKTVAKGVPYRNMLTHTFPLLRRTEYQLNYSVRDFTVNQGREVFKTQPGQLSLNEMFHVANSYDTSTDDFKEVFEVAARIFPQDPVANINAAAVAILRSDTVTAAKFLSRVKDDPRADNNQAALFILCGDLEKAKYFLEKSARVGLAPDQVKHNLSEIEHKEKENALFDKYGKK